jgi:tetratricopeptide (TPR) repeat protein
MKINLFFLLLVLSMQTIWPLTAKAQQASFDTIASWIETAQYSRALAALEEHFESGGTEAQTYFLQGVAYFQQAKLAKAEASFTALIEAYPQLPEAYINLAAVHAEQGAYQNAQTVLQQAIQLAPDSALAYISLGDLYVIMAEQAYDQANRIDSKDAYAATRAELLRTLNAD